MQTAAVWTAEERPAGTSLLAGLTTCLPQALPAVYSSGHVREWFIVRRPLFCHVAYAFERALSPTIVFY
jgi:hypothetical protein